MDLFGIPVRTDPRIPPGRAYLVPSGHPLLRMLDGEDPVDDEVPDADHWAEFRRLVDEQAHCTAVITSVE